MTIKRLLSSSAINRIFHANQYERIVDVFSRCFPFKFSDLTVSCGNDGVAARACTLPELVYCVTQIGCYGFGAFDLFEDVGGLCSPDKGFGLAIVLFDIGEDAFL